MIRGMTHINIYIYIYIYNSPWLYYIYIHVYLFMSIVCIEFIFLLGVHFKLWTLVRYVLKIYTDGVILPFIQA